MNTPIKKLAVTIAFGLLMILSFFIYINSGIFSVISFLCACVISTMTLITVCTPYGSENVFDRHKKGSILIMTITLLLLVISITLKWQFCKDNPGVFGFVFDNINEYFASDNLFNYYTAQLSLTFITISVMSVLSDKSVIIYWSNVSEDMLIRPTFSCFAAFTYYSIGTTIGSGLGVVLNNSAMFTIFFALNILILICLTLSMIDVYYGRDTKKTKLAKTLIPDNENKTSYENKILSLEQNVLYAYDQKDVVFLREVYELYCDYPEKFMYDIGQEAIAIMVSTLDAQTTGPFLRAYDKVVTTRLAAFPLNKDEIVSKHTEKANKPLYDKCLWWILSSNRAEKFLDEISVKGDYSTANEIAFTRIIMRRLTLEYNMYAMTFLSDKIKNGESVDPNQYFVSDDPRNSIYNPKTVEGTYVAFECFKEVFDYIKLSMIYDSLLFDSIILILDRMLKDGKNWYTFKTLSALPFIDYWTNGGLDGGLGAYKPEVREAVKRLKEIQDSMDIK